MLPQSQLPRVLRFGIFEIDVRAGELHKNGIKLKLQEQPFQVLCMLVEHPGEVVTREELRSRLWPTDTFVDFDHGLNAAVKRLRDALGDVAENPRFVETLARRGYRFIAQVNVDTTQRPPDAAASTTIPTTKGAKSAPAEIRWGYLGVLAVAVLIAIGLVGALRLNKTPSGVHGDRIESLAVLPLENISRDPEQDYFSDGMTEVLTADLSKISALRVASRRSAMRYKATNKTLAEIARELNVDGVIEGSVLRSGNRVRITAELLDARTDRHLWGETYERDVGDVLILQSELAQAIAERIQARLTSQQQSRLRSTSVVNPESYESYLKGRYYELNSGGTPLGIENAQKYFQDAIRRDPTFAGSYVSLADSYLDLGAFRRLPPQDAYRSANEAIRKALRIDDTLGEAHITLGYLIWQFEWDWPNAEKEIRYGVETSPNYFEGLQTLTWFLAWSGRSSEALTQVAKMRQLDPAYSLSSGDESGINYHRRDYKALLETSRAFVALNPEAWVGHYFLGVSYDGLGRPAEAIPEYQRAVELSQADMDATAGLAHAYAAAGRRIEAEKILRELQEQSKTSYVSPYMIGAIYAGLGRKDKAFEFLEAAYKEKSPDVVYFLRADLRIDSLRSDPRFRDLLRRMNFPK